MNVVDNEEVHLLLDGNISPHDYHLKPSDMKKLTNADVIFYIDDDSIETFLHRGLNATKAKKELGWKPKINFKDLVKEMMIYDLKDIK